MKISELLNELGNFPAPGSGIIVDPNYKDPVKPIVGKSPVPVPKTGAPAVPTPTPTPAPVVPTEPAPFNPATSKDLLIKVARSKGITNINDLSQLLGQADAETAGWTMPVEKIKYTDPERVRKVFTTNFPTVNLAQQYINKNDWVAFANKAYANINGNGDEASGDGWRYRGRGFLHITGKELYAKAGASAHPENPGIYVQNPSLLGSNPLEAAKASVWYFLYKNLKGKTSKQATAKVNPAGLKAKERGQAAKAAKKELIAKSANKR
jgi:putative chitinase